MEVVSPVRPPLITGGKTVKDVTQDICVQVESKPSMKWMMAFGVALTAFGIGFIAIYRTLFYGIGEWSIARLRCCHQRIQL